MRTVSSAWPRRTHGELQQLSDNLWFVDGPVPGMLYRRQMVVARDETDGLLLHSAIALDAAGMSHLEALGSPAWLVVPNGHHRLDAAAFKRRYPELRVVAPAGAVQRVRAAVSVDLTYETFPSGQVLTLEAAPWRDAQEGVVRVHSSDGVTLVFNDLLWTPPQTGWTARWYRLLRQQPQVPWLAQRLLVADVVALKCWLITLAQTDGLARIIPGHGAPILHDARDALLRVAAALA